MRTADGQTLMHYAADCEVARPSVKALSLKGVDANKRALKELIQASAGAMFVNQSYFARVGKTDVDTRDNF